MNDGEEFVLIGGVPPRAREADQAAIDQRWAQAREWLWSIDPTAAQWLDEMLAKQGEAEFVRALSASKRTVEIVRYLAVLAYDTIIHNCLDEQVAMEEEIQIEIEVEEESGGDG